MNLQNTNEWTVNRLDDLSDGDYIPFKVVSNHKLLGYFGVTLSTKIFMYNLLEDTINKDDFIDFVVETISKTFKFVPTLNPRY